MIEPHDEEVVEALVMLEHTHHFRAIIQWIERSYERTQDACEETRDEIDLRRAQGAAQDLKAILQASRDAREKMQKIKDLSLIHI